MIFLLLSLLAAAGAVTLQDAPVDLSATQAEFAQFKAKFGKRYADAAEEQRRHVAFVASKARAAQKNAFALSVNSTARYGVTLFSDLSPEEFKVQYLTANIEQEDSYRQAMRLKRAHERRRPKHETEQLEKLVQATSHIDWRDHGLVTRVKNQAQCGSCWAFSATEEIESMLLKTYPSQYKNTTLALSPQQIVDCDQTSAGCGGGLTESAWDYVIQAGGIESNASYPYAAVDQQCAFDKSKVVATIKSYTPATSWYSETELLQTLVKEGPISVCVDAANWQDYTSGIMDRYECAWVNVLDHCVQLVGYDSTGPTPYWIIRNSWTTQWGIEGYIYVSFNLDSCGVANDANYVTV